MSTKEQLARRLSAQEMDEVIERATKLQEAQASPSGHTMADIKAVGAELDLDARFIEQAERDMRAAREAASRQAVLTQASRRKLAMGGAASLAGVLVVGWLGGMGVRSAAGDADLARGNLDTVLRRQSSLVPQLLALSGGDASKLGPLQQQVESAGDIEARARAADQLQMDMAQALGKLPPAADPSQSQQRLSLQHELVGATNRISTERRRYEESLARWRQSASGLFGGLSTMLGMAPKPPR